MALPPGIPFDVRGAGLSHRDGRCAFQRLLDTYELRTAGLQHMGTIMRGADLPHDEGLPPEALGVLAVFDGIRETASPDPERLEHGSAVCDALYAYCSDDRRKS